MMSDTKGDFSYEGYAIVELLGHRRLGGHVMAVTFCGVPMLLVNVPGDGDTVVATQLVNPQALYCLTPCSEAAARAVAAANRPEPVHRYEMPTLPLSHGGGRDDMGFEHDEYDDETEEDR